MSKGFWAIIAIIAIVFGGILFFKDHNKANAPGSGQPTNHVEGAGQKKVTLVEYGDYQCPFCEQYYPVVKQVVEKYKNDIVFQFRNMPLTQVHDNALAGARAAEAAGLQNKYWEMHDLLYENQDKWVPSKSPIDAFSIFAKQLGLNVDTFKKDFASARVNDFINNDIAEFNKTKLKVETPTFLLDGKKVTPSLRYTDNTQQTVDVQASVATFSKVLDDEIATKTGTATTSQPGGSQNPQ